MILMKSVKLKMVKEHLSLQTVLQEILSKFDVMDQRLGVIKKYAKYGNSCRNDATPTNPSTSAESDGKKARLIWNNNNVCLTDQASFSWKDLNVSCSAKGVELSFLIRAILEPLLLRIIF